MQTSILKQAESTKTRHRNHMRRVKSEILLYEVLPTIIENGDSWHIISHGDVDAMSYLVHAVKSAGYLSEVLISTWCIARPDLQQLERWLDHGIIDNLSLYVGEIFTSQYPEEYELAKRLCSTYQARMVVARNHSKVILAANQASDIYLVMEGSANVNTNPRIEQTVYTRDQSLFEFYREFYHGIQSIDRSTRILRKSDPSRTGKKAWR